MATSLSADTLIVGQDVFTSSSTQMHNLGQKAVTQDGRAFRYILAGATALVAGKLQQASAEDTSNFQNLTVATASAGATSMTTSSTVTLTANQLANGLLTVTSATTGVGQTLRIKGNTAATAAVTTIYLDDPVITATTGTVKIDMIPSPYSSVIVNPATATSSPIGVAVYPITAAQYGWVQVSGPVACLADGAITVGTSLCASNGTAGAVEALAGVQAPIGYALTGIATTEYGMIFLKIG